MVFGMPRALFPALATTFFGGGAATLGFLYAAPGAGALVGGPRLGDLESGAVAAGFGDTVSVVSGGLACIAGALLLARLLPGFRHQRASASHHAPVSSPVASAEGEPPARADGIDEAV